MSWDIVIGIETHVQLRTNTKQFSGASVKYGADPNSQACLVSMAYPGVLPVLNKESVTSAIRFGLSVDAEIAQRSIFARKNYFYPDLPKGYQISQYELPIVGKGKLSIESMQGGTFTISNGGIYGSLLSTPILNPPQSGILGMHTIQERPVAVDGKVEIRPMMYLALSYDHRMVDGKEAVTFLIKVKECLESPASLLLEL